MLGGSQRRPDNLTPGPERPLTPDWGDGPLDASKARLGDLIEDIGTKTLTYLYDFGDGWEHTIRIERLSAPVPGSLYPQLIEAIGRCPPEDVGGPWGYTEFLDAINDPKHERHTEFTEWIADDFDPTDADVDQLAADVTTLSKSWSRKPATKRPRSP